MNVPFVSTTTWGNAEGGIVAFESGHIQFIDHRSISEPSGIVVWGVRSDSWADETNGWYSDKSSKSNSHEKN